MKPLTLWLIALTALPVAASAEPSAVERLGTVSFSVSCSPAVGVPFNRGVALLHNFWYEEAQRQFEQIAKTDPPEALLESTDNGAQSARPECDHVKVFFSSTALALQ